MLSFSFLSRVSLLCFLKKWPKIDLFWAVFFTPEKANERFLPQNHSQTTSSLYLFINSFTHNNTYYKTTHIKIHHSERRRANANAIVFAAALSLSHKCCCCLNNAKERARLFLSFFKSEIHQIIFLSSVDNIKRRGIRF